MDQQYTNYFDALSQSMYPQQTNDTSAFLSPEPHPPSLSASPVSSEGSDSLIDEALRYGLFGYDHSSAAAYISYNQNSVNNFVAASTPVHDHSSPTVVVKHEDSFGYDPRMAFDRAIAPSLTTYQPLTGYTAQERNPIFDYPVQSNTVGSLANMLVDSAPFATVAPSATSGLAEEDTSAYNLSTGIAELSISSPASSPAYHAGSLSSSPSSMPIPQPQPTPVCDPKALSSPVIMESPTIQAGPSRQAKGSRRNKTSSYRLSTADSDYSPSGESEVEDANDRSFGEVTTRKKARSARVSHAAHPYLRPASKAKGNKRRATQLEIPIPVPGLTKNSRGRTVPKKTEEFFGDGSRPFWCPVEDCHKLFNRGEHLKRHILSIHTDDKPFRCECENKFSRRDNLFQHMRAKGCVVWYKNGVKQCESKDEETLLKEQEEAEDLYIERVMADAKIAQEKRDRACKQARLRS